MINLGGKNSIEVSPGDIIKIITPGGGGYGKIKQNKIWAKNAQKLAWFENYNYFKLNIFEI